MWALQDRLQYIRDRESELWAEAAANRVPTRRERRSRTFRISGLHLQVGHFMIVVGRERCDDDLRGLYPAA